MRPRCARSPPLLVLVLCWLVARPALGLPVRPSSAPPRDLEESASGDDLISGSDFLSVFIGASIPQRQGRTRGLSGPRSKVGEEPEQNLGAFGARLIPKPRSSKASAQPPPPSRPPPPPPPPPPLPPRVAGDAHSEPKSRFLDLSNSKAPSIEAVSFDPSNIDINPLPEASARIAHRAEPNTDFQSESLTKSNTEDETTRVDTSEYYSQIPTEDSFISSDSIATTSKDDLPDLTVSDVGEDQVSVNPNVKVITEVVTSREELVPSTEPTNVVSSQDSQEHGMQAPISYQSPVIAGKSSGHPAKSSSDDHQNSLAVTMPSTDDIVTIPRIGDAATGDAPPPPPPVQQVVSVRVSSSVVQGPSPAPHVSRAKTKPEETSVTKHDGLAHTPAAPASEEEMQRQIEGETANSIAGETTFNQAETSAAPSLDSELEPPQAPAPALVTEEQPTNIAVQRSEFSVEEASPSSSELSPRRDDPAAYHKTVARVVEVSRNSQSAPVSYQTSVSSATSGSRVQFYSEPPSYHREMPSNVAESIRTSVVTSHQHTSSGSSRPKYEHVSGGPMGGSSEEAIENRMGRYGTPHHEVRISGPHERVSFSSMVRSSQERSRGPAATGREQKSYQHVPAPERNYAQPERNYGQPERNYAEPERNYAQTERNYAHPERRYSLPERNYEVDEAVSVMSNGRAHGVQPTTPASPAAAPPQQQQPAAPEAPPPTHAGPSVERAIGVLDTSQGRDPNHKFGYVVEGRNFRKYRVEERTPDGFIVGEYGVVSHDDGTLRGVRYTADGTINPQLIYEALVKFLSL